MKAQVWIARPADARGVETAVCYADGTHVTYPRPGLALAVLRGVAARRRELRRAAA